ncbi:MAG: hypothetical protein WCO06_00020 [Candidatus Roizmanbacteria bacterium]
MSEVSQQGAVRGISFPRSDSSVALIGRTDSRPPIDLVTQIQRRFTQTLGVFGLALVLTACGATGTSSSGTCLYQAVDEHGYAYGDRIEDNSDATRQTDPHTGRTYISNCGKTDKGYVQVSGP